MAPQPVVLSGRLVAYYGHICASGGHPTAYGLFRQAAGPARQPQRVPNLLCQSLHPMPSPVLRGAPRLRSTMPSSRVMPSPLSHWLGNPRSHPAESGGSCNEAAAFASCYGLAVLLALLGQGFYNRAYTGRVAPSRVGYDWMAHRHLPSPDLHRLDWQPYGLQTKGTNGGRLGPPRSGEETKGGGGDGAKRAECGVDPPVLPG